MGKEFNPDDLIVINCSHENDLKGWSIGGAGVTIFEDADDEKDVFVPSIYLKSPYECVVQHHGEPVVGRFTLITQDHMVYGPRITGEALSLDNGKMMRLGKDDVIDWTKAHDVNDSNYKVTGYEPIGDGTSFFSQNKKTIEGLFCDVRKTLSERGLYKFGWGSFKDSPPSNVIERRNGSISITNLDRKSVENYSALSPYYAVTVPVPKSFSDSGLMRLTVPKEDVDRAGPGVWEKNRLNFDRKTESFSARVLRDGHVENIVISAEDIAKQHGQYLHDEAATKESHKKEESRRKSEEKTNEEVRKGYENRENRLAGLDAKFGDLAVKDERQEPHLSQSQVQVQVGDRRAILFHSKVATTEVSKEDEKSFIREKLDGRSASSLKFEKPIKVSMDDVHMTFDSYGEASDHLFAADVKVPKSFADNGQMKVFFHSMDMEVNGDTVSMGKYLQSESVPVEYQKNGMKKNTRLSISTIVDLYNKGVKSDRRLPDVPEGTVESNEMQME